MTQGGRWVWESELPYTLQDARVTSDGSVVGHASSTGRPLQAREGELVVLILAPDGNVRGLDRHEYEWSQHLEPACVGQVTFWRGPYPRASQLELFEPIDKAVLRASARLDRDDEWWVYSVSTGQRLGRLPSAPGFMQDWTSPSNRQAEDPRGVDLEGLAEVQLLPRGAVSFEVPGDVEGGYRLLDSLGRVLFVDRRTFSVLAFEPRGRLLFVARPAPEDLGRGFVSRMPQWIAARGDGGLWVREMKGLVEFGPDGTRVGRSGEEDWVTPKRCFLPHSQESWEVDWSHGVIHRLDAHGRSLRSIERGANDRWLRILWRPVVGPDGSLAIIDRSGASSGTSWLHVFDDQGRPASSTELPRGPFYGSLAFDGQTAALLHGDGNVLFVVRDGTIAGRSQIRDLAEPDGIAFSPEGELWVFAGSAMRRYAPRW